MNVQEHAEVMNGTGRRTSAASPPPSLGDADLEAAYLSAFRTLLVTGNHPAFLRFLYVHNPLEASETGLSGSRDYYVFGEDEAALAELGEHRHADAFALVEAIVDLGAGDAVALTRKVAPFLALPSVRRYWAVDANPRVFGPLRESVRRLAPHVSFAASQAAFLDDPGTVPVVPAALYLMLGNTIADLPVYSLGRSADDAMTRYLTGLRQRIPPSSRLIVSIDTGSDPDRIMRAYRSDLTTAFLQRGLDWLGGRDPVLGPACAALVPDVSWDAAARCVVFAYRARCTVAGPFRLTEGDRLVAGVSYRLSPEAFAGCLRGAGFSVEGSAGPATGTVRLFLAT